MPDHKITTMNAEIKRLEKELGIAQTVPRMTSYEKKRANAASAIAPRRAAEPSQRTAVASRPPKGTSGNPISLVESDDDNDPSERYARQLQKQFLKELQEDDAAAAKRLARQ